MADDTKTKRLKPVARDRSLEDTLPSVPRAKLQPKPVEDDPSIGETLPSVSASSIFGGEHTLPGDDEDIAEGQTLQGVSLQSLGLDKDIRPARRDIPTPPDPEGLATSAPVKSIAASAQTSGSVKITTQYVSESAAREVINDCFGRVGLKVQADVPFSHEDILVRLDGYDENSRVGYQFISHHGEDVINDFDAETEKRFESLGDEDVVHLLVIHDHQAPDEATLRSKVDDFLRALGFLTV